MDEEFLKRLACPACKVGLDLVDQKLECRQCHRKFPVRDGVPVLLLDEAETPQDS